MPTAMRIRPPQLYGRGLNTDAVEGGRLGAADTERGGEDEQHEHQAGDGEGGERGGGPADRDGVADQTGQDGPRSAEPREHVAEPEQREPGDGRVAADLAERRRIGPTAFSTACIENGSRPSWTRPSRMRTHADDPADRDAGRARERHAGEQRLAAEPDDDPGEDHEGGGAERKRTAEHERPGGLGAAVGLRPKSASPNGWVADDVQPAEAPERHYTPSRLQEGLSRGST
jgi:hypothetical protein